MKSSVLKTLAAVGIVAMLAGLIATNVLVSSWVDQPYYAAPPPASLRLGTNDVGYSPALPEFPAPHTNAPAPRIP